MSADELGHAGPPSSWPNVIVSDVSIPGLDGIAAVTQILQRSPPHGSCSRPFIAIPLLMERGFETGALGDVRTAAAGEELINAVRSGLCGESSHR